MLYEVITLLVLLVQHDAKRHVERIESEVLPVIAELLHARLMTYRRKWIGGTCPGIGGINSPLPVNLEQVLCAGVIWLHIPVGDGPPGRDSAVMDDLPEILLTEPEQRSAIELGVSPDIVVRVRV